MNLTVEQIEKDIAGYKDSIQTVQNEIAALPTGHLLFKEHKKREKIRRDCKAEVKHCQKLIVYAREGIAIRLIEMGTNN